MEWKWLILLICGSIFQSYSARVIVSRKFNNRLAKRIGSGAEAVEAGGTLRSSWNFGADPHVSALSTYDRSEIGDANPMCHIVTFRRRLESLSNVAGNIDCTREIVFDDCCQPFFLMIRTSGIYPIRAGRKGYAYCDQTTDGGGWVVVARRAGGGRSFNKTWRHFKKGFGPLDKDFWIGLDSLSYLTSPLLSSELRFDMRHRNGTWFHAYYNQIVVAPEEENYMLTVRGYDPDRSTIYDSFSMYDQTPFSAKDKHNLAFSSLCARMLNNSGAGWWWNNDGLCVTVNMHFPYYVYSKDGQVAPRGVFWISLDDAVRTSFEFMEMKVRPKQWRCGNLPHFYWEYIQNNFLNREVTEEEEEDEEEPIVAPTTSPPHPATSDPDVLPTSLPKAQPSTAASALRVTQPAMAQPPTIIMPAPSPTPVL